MSTRELAELFRQMQGDPVRFARACWPQVTFSSEQIALLDSVEDNIETYVKAGNMLGKDFIAAFLVLYFFLTRHPCRIVTTSVDSSQLEAVLWGEIRNFIQTSRIPLDSEKGGPILVNHLHLRKIVKGQVCGLSYVIGRVSKKGEGLLGHHIAATGDGIPRTLALGDEASGLDEEAHTKMTTWANRLLFIGNPYPCNNFFKNFSKEGNLPNPSQPGKFFRRVFKIKGEDSPNVRRALEEIRAYRVSNNLSDSDPLPSHIPSGKMIVPGLLSYAEYIYRRATWDAIRQCVSLDAEFYEGKEILLYPPDWLDRAERFYKALFGRKRIARAIGIDPAEGGDKTAMSAVDEYGLIEVVSKKTPDTSVIAGEVIAFGKKHGAPPDNWVIDRGGGGKQVADNIRKLSSEFGGVRTVAFGETVTPNPKRGLNTVEQQIDNREERYAYVSRRAQMCGELSLLLDPSGFGNNELWEMIADRFNLKLTDLEQGFAIPPNPEIRKQLAPIPKLYDHEGRLRMLPKNKKSKDSTEQTLVELIGHSPDEYDSIILAVHGMLHKGTRFIAGGY